MKLTVSAKMALAQVDMLGRAERKAVAGLKVKNKTNKVKTRQELMDFVFGTTTPVPSEVNARKRIVMGKSFCTITTKTSTLNGRLSKEDLTRVDVIMNNSTVNFYDCKLKEKIDIKLEDIMSITASHITTTF